MVFSSAVFLFLFLPAVLVLYFLPVFFWNDAWETARKNTVLCLASLLFYAWGEPVYVILMLLSIAFNYYIGLDIGRHADRPSRQKIILAAAVVFDLLILGFFKYGNFLIDNLNGLLAWDIEPLQVSLPVGISFYTFQILSYVVDVYRGTVKPQKNPVAFAMYVTMFPQLIAGPIVQYADIEKRLGKRQVTPEGFFDGVTVFLRGLGKKVLFANTIGRFYTEIAAGDVVHASAATMWLGIACYTMQIYFDFGGYSDMAIGLGRMFGFEFLRNFNFPYLADSVKDFWRRWHISLSSWFRDYVYIPLGGSRRGTLRTVINLAVVWSLTGLWHGAAWNFIAWGAFYGLLLIGEKFVWAGILPKIPGWARHIGTMMIVMIGWVFFASDSMGDALVFLRSMFCLNGNAPWDASFVYYLSSCAFPLALMSLSAFGICDRLPKPRRQSLRMAGSGIFYAVVLVLSVICLVSSTYNPFLYFRF